MPRLAHVLGRVHADQAGAEHDRRFGVLHRVAQLDGILHRAQDVMGHVAQARYRRQRRRRAGGDEQLVVTPGLAGGEPQALLRRIERHHGRVGHEIDGVGAEIGSRRAASPCRAASVPTPHKAGWSANRAGARRASAWSSVPSPSIRRMAVAASSAAWLEPTMTYLLCIGALNRSRSARPARAGRRPISIRASMRWRGRNARR